MADDSIITEAESLTIAQTLSELDDLSARSNRIQRDLFRAILKCELRGVWVYDDARDFPHWLALRMGISTWKARRWVECARVLDRYPRFAEAFEQGLLSLDKLVELTRLADIVHEDEDEDELLAWALKASSGAIRDRADWAKKITLEDTAAADRGRSVRWWWNDDRSYVTLYGDLPADMGLRITTALDRLAAKMPVAPEDSEDDCDVEDEWAMERRRADALDALAGKVLADDGDLDRATVIVHAPLSALIDGDANGTGPTGETVAPEVIQRLRCDGRVEIVLHGDNGAVVGIGYTSRVIPRWLRRQVLRRDHFRCTFPNCGSRLGLDVHHVVPWPDGPTDIDNLTCLCRAHHRLAHDHGWHIVPAPDQSAQWFRPDWTPYVPRPPSEVAEVEQQRRHEQAVPEHPTIREEVLSHREVRLRDARDPLMRLSPEAVF